MGAGAGIAPRGEATAVLVYLAVAVTLCFGWMGSTDIHVMEGIVADGAREMVRSGDYAVPRLHGEIYMYKPPLSYWLAAIPLQLGLRETEWALRAPFALCSLLLGLSVLWLSGPLLGPRRGLTCALATLTGGLMLEKLNLAEFDMPLALGVGVAAVAAAANLARERPSARLWWLAYLALAAGFLAKGGPALILFGPGLLLAAAVTGRLRELLRPAHLAGVALLLLIAGGWIFAVVEASGWEAFEQPLAEARDKGFNEWSPETVARALGRPLLVVALFLPWSVLLPIVLRRRWWRSLPPRERRLALAVAAFALVGGLAFTVVSATESRYFLPLAAPVGVLLGMAARPGRPEPGGRGPVDRALPFLTGALALAALVAALGPWPVAPGMRAVAAAVGLAGAGLILAACRRPAGTLRGPMLLAAAFGLWVAHTAVVEPARVGKRTLRPVAEAFRPHLVEGETLWTTPVAKGFHHSGLFFYLGRQVRTVGPISKPVPGSALVLFSDEPVGRPDYRVPVEYSVVESRRRRGTTFALARTGRRPAPTAALTPEGIREVVARAADWQLAHPLHPPRDWTNAVFYAGLLAAHRVTGEARYLEEPLRVGAAHGWEPGPRVRHADDHAVAQSYLELHRVRPQPGMVEPFRRVADRMIAAPPDWPDPHQPIDYWWSDALFMSPPALALLASVTGERRYLDLMERLWRQARDLLYDREERLFHRDARWIVGAGGTFWSRGNAWVLAGIARVFDELPADHPSRQILLPVYRRMAERIAALQAADGLWRADLQASPLAAPGESSGSALFCYALARGVERGLLDRERYLPVVRDAWAGLYGNVTAEGRLGWVQRPGIGPAEVRSEDWEVYGTGALLLAAEAMLSLLDGEGSEPLETD